jgi:hypothetical protein
LGIGDEVIHERGKSSGNHLRNHLCNCMDYANRPKVGDFLGPSSFFGNNTMFAEFIYCRCAMCKLLK